MQSPLVDKEYVMQKIPGKGGWTYVVIEEIAPDKRAKFGWVQVSGRVDTFELVAYKLMPMGDGRLFLPIRAEIRKKIKKKEGDSVHVVLYLDHSTKEIPEEFLLCLDDDEPAKAFFETLSQSEQRYYIDWIYAAKTEETKVDRIVNTLRNLAEGRKFMQKLNFEN
jgi:Bacteriocin-protection, YdeI or OmpD-Associated/Domain of unknown function (DUF1905)